MCSVFDKSDDLVSYLLKHVPVVLGSTAIQYYVCVYVWFKCIAKSVFDWYTVIIPINVVFVYGVVYMYA